MTCDQSAPVDTVNFKDRRTLVLFLLGLTLLFFDFCPSRWGNALSWYQVALSESKGQWRVLCLPEGGTFDSTKVHETFGLPEDFKVVPFVSGDHSAIKIPVASLSLFVNRPLPINTADRDALEMLPGVGPHLANAILSELQHQGKFTSPDDLLKVSGIGSKNMQHLLPLISFE